MGQNLQGNLLFMNIEYLVINLDRSKERLENASSQLAANNISFTRISAVDGKSLSDSDSRLKRYNKELNIKQYYKPLTKGEIGCYLSHIACWEYIVKHKIPFAIVLEDDFMIKNNLSLIEDFLSNAVENWDYVKLSNYPNRPRKSNLIKQLESGNLVGFKNIPAGTCAQLISLHGARTLLENSTEFGRPIDVDLQHWWEKKLKVYGLRPFPFQPTPEIESDITRVENRSDVKKHRVRRLKQQLKFKILKTWHNRRQKNSNQ